ncbi:hypothetical protein DFH11DRAFT_1691420 [Phellopilus nigrolimitatus]|nr:hypothetical protein DFH11DRAFT_1691420 [Phellopilus nigrolimitatus]
MSCSTSSTRTPSVRSMGEILSSLPKEILGEIFYWVCPTFNDRFSTEPMSALILSHVCRLWREVAFTTPKIWTYASLRAPRQSIASPVALTKLWISNSKSCPLVIDLDLSQFASYKKPDSVLPTVKELTALAAQAKPSLLSTDTIPLTVTVQPSVSVKFPHLVEEYYWSRDEIGKYARSTLQLRILTKPCFSLGMEGHKDFAPYLVHLDLRDHENRIGMTTDECLGMMRFYGNLRHVALRIEYTSDDTHATHTLTNLKTLCLSWKDAGSPAPVLDCLHAPNLECLELNGVLAPADFTFGGRWDHLLNFLARSAPPLRSLDLYKLRCADIDILACLACCNGIERLWLQECTIDELLVSEFLVGRHLRVEEAQHNPWSLRTLGLRFFREFCLSGLVWQGNKLDDLYISDCNVHEGIPKTLHLLRTRFEAGEYDSLA